MKKRFLQKCIAGGGISAAILFLSCGCGQNGADSVRLDPDHPTQITIWHYYNGAQQTAFDQLVEEFNRTEGRELGIYVTANSQGNVSDLESSVLASFHKEVGSSEPPDIFSSYADTAYSIDKLGMLVDLDDYMTQEELDTYVDSFVEEGRGLLAELIEKYELPCDWDEVFHATEGYMLRHYREDARPKPGAEAYLRSLAGRGIKMCVGTASLREFVDEALSRLGMRDYFEFITDNRELALEKSDPEFFRAVAARLGVAPERMCVFEDAPYAMRGAKEAGCPVIGILDPTQAGVWEQIEALADRCVRDYRELLDAAGENI